MNKKLQAIQKAAIYAAQYRMSPTIFRQMLNPRCNSKLYIKQASSEWLGLDCVHEEHGEEKEHLGYAPTTKHIQWSTQKAIESKRDFYATRISKRDKPIEAWRTWLVDGMTLQSTGVSCLWEGPTMTTLASARVKSTIMHGDMGVHCYKTPNLLLTHFFGAIPGEKYPISFLYILGRIDISGHVVEHQHGYRAQKAIIRELWILRQADMPQTIDMWRESFLTLYECPVHILAKDQIQHWANFYSQQTEENSI